MRHLHVEEFTSNAFCCSKTTMVADAVEYYSLFLNNMEAVVCLRRFPDNLILAGNLNRTFNFQ